ncbi:MAG: hypothetical protein HY591_01455 [Candidatus Omnitrophica bacterium]|nr:hypothetical protein [Candidatus Omnitrophota bacterium]
MNFQVGLLIFLVLCSARPAWAEIIKLKSGQVVEGKVLKEESASILVDVGIGTPVTYFRDEIKEMAPDPKPPAQAQAQDARLRADALESQAVELIDADKMDQGLDLIAQAMALDPLPQRRMNYGSILFGNGVALFKKGRLDEGRSVLRQSEQQLNKAIAAFDQNKDTAFLGQIYFLLGEMYANAFADAAKALEFYKKAVSLAGHDGAKAALEKFAQDSQNP